jgi:two-component system response regulator NreC
MIRILIADDHQLIRRGLADLIAGEADLTAVGEASDSDETLRLAAALRPDVVLLDINMPGVGGIEVARQLCAAQPAPRVLILTGYEDESLLREALRAGAMGYIVKRAADNELIEALRTVARGDPYVHASMTRALLQSLRPAPPPAGDEPAPVEALTLREQEVLRLLAQGYTNRQVADELSISVRTAEGHRGNIMSKLGLRSRLDLVAYAQKHSLL